MAARNVTDDWDVRGFLDGDGVSSKRYKEARREIGCRLDTQLASVLVNLHKNGRLSIRLTKPGNNRITRLITGTLTLDEAGNPVFKEESSESGNPGRPGSN